MDEEVLNRLQHSVAHTTAQRDDWPAPVHGTAFLITKTHALTCAHCLRSRGDDTWARRVTLHFSRRGEAREQEAEVIGEPIWGQDVAILKLLHQSGEDVTPLDLALQGLRDERWETFAHPKPVGKAGLVMGGTVQDPGAYLPYRQGHIRVIQLTCDQGQDSIQGASGGPVVVNDTIIGMLNNQLVEALEPESYAPGVPQKFKPVYAVAYALPLETIQNLLQTTCPKLHFVPLVAARVRPAATVKLSRRLEIETDILIAKEGYHPDIYIERAAGHLARTALAQRGGVVIIGKPKSGKTRLAWQLLQEHPEAIVVIPKQAQPPEPFGAAGFGGKEVVLFFDDLHSRASSIDPLAWRRRFEDATGQPCLLLCTSRDGADWQRVKGQPHLAYLWESVLRPDTWVFTSKCDAQGEDLPEAEARQLGDALRLSAQEFKRRFDGTPGSLTLDLSAMRERYARLRDEQRGNMALGRLLDSAKLLHAAYQPRLHLAVLRAVAEQIRGDGHMSNEAWDTLKRRTQEEGFGYFAREDFKTYVPYLEECVDYTPDTHELEALLPILVEARDYDGLISLGDAFLFGPQALLPNAERAYREATGGDSAFAYYMLSFVLCNQPGRETEAEQACQAAIERGYTAAYIVLGRIHARQPGHECEAEQTYRQAITLADTANTISSAYVNLAVLLECQPGREQDAEQAYREAMKASDEVPRFYLGKFLARRPGREAEAEELLQDAIAKHADREVYDSFVKEACFYLGYLLANQPGREAEAERMLQDALSRKVRLYHADFHETRAQLEEMAYSRLGSLLANQPGQAAAAEQVYTEGIKAGYKKLYIDLGRLLSTQPGRREEAILAFLKAAQAGIPMPSSHVRIRPPAS